MNEHARWSNKLAQASSRRCFRGAAEGGTMNCRVRWIEQRSGRNGFFYSCLTDQPKEWTFIEACAYASDQQATSNKWGRAASYQVVDSAGEVVYETSLAREKKAHQ